MTDMRTAVLSMIGGAPLNQVAPVIAELLPIPNISTITGLGSILSNVLAIGPSALFQNPVAGAISGLSSSISSIVGSVPAGVATALTGASGLTIALSSLQGTTDLLSGAVQATDTQFGLSDVLNHAQITASMFGASVPSSVSLDSVLAPINLQSALSGEVMSYVNALPAAISGGSITAAAAIAQIGAYSSTITSAISSSSSAISTLQGALQSLSNASSLAGNLVGGPAGVQDFLTSIVAPSAQSAVQSAVNSYMSGIFEALPTSISETGVL